MVDVLGGLNDAIAIAVEKSGLEKYRVVEYPEKEDFATRLMKGLSINPLQKVNGILEQVKFIDFLLVVEIVRIFRFFYQENNIKIYQLEIH